MCYLNVIQFKKQKGKKNLNLLFRMHNAILVQFDAMTYTLKFTMGL